MSTAIKRADSPQLRDAIFALEEKMLQQEQIPLEIINRFVPGIYARELFMPAGTLATGLIHKTEHISIMLCGKMLMPDGKGGSEEIVGPRVEIAQPGIKRVGFVMEDIRWITIHPTDETDVDILEDALVTNDFSEVEYLVDQQDYKLLAEEYGLSDEVLDKYKQIPVTDGDEENLVIQPSARHGNGVFVKDLVSAGAIIGPAIKEGRLMNYSRYANHSANPNARRLNRPNGDVDFIALRDIEDEEVLINYREVLHLEVQK